MSIERSGKVKIGLSRNLDGIHKNPSAPQHHLAEQNTGSADVTTLNYSETVSQSSSEVRTSRRKLGSSRRNKVGLQKDVNLEPHKMREEENPAGEASFEKSSELHASTNETLLSAQLLHNILQEDPSNIQLKKQTPDHWSTENRAIMAELNESISEENRGLRENQMIQQREVRHEETTQGKARIHALKLSVTKMSQEEMSQLSMQGTLYLPSIPHQSLHSITASTEAFVEIPFPKSEASLTNDHVGENYKKLEQMIPDEITPIEATGIGCIVDQSLNTLPTEELLTNEIISNFKVSENTHLFIQSHNSKDAVYNRVQGQEPLQIEEIHSRHDFTASLHNVDSQETPKTELFEQLVQDILNTENKHWNDLHSGDRSDTTTEEIGTGENHIYKDEDQAENYKVFDQDREVERFPRKTESIESSFQKQSESGAFIGEQTKLSGKRRKMGSTRIKLWNNPNQTTDEGLKQNECNEEHRETSELETARAFIEALCKSTSPEHTVHNIESSISETYLFDDKTHLNPAVTGGQHCPSSEEAQHHLKERNSLEVPLQDNIVSLEEQRTNEKTNQLEQQEENKDISNSNEDVKKEESFQAHSMLLCRDRSSDIQDIIKSRTNTFDEVNDKEVSQHQKLKEIVSDENYTVKKQLIVRNLPQEELSSHESTYGTSPHSSQNENVFAYRWDAVKMDHKEDPLRELSDSEVHVSEKDKVANADKMDDGHESQQRSFPKPDQNKDDAQDDHQDEAREDDLNIEVNMLSESSLEAVLKLKVEPKCNMSDFQDMCDLHEELEKTENTQNATDITSASLISTQTLNQDPNITINMGLSEVVSGRQLSIIQMRDTDEAKTERKTVHSISSLLVQNDTTEEAPEEKKEVTVNLKLEETGDTLQTGIVQILPNRTYRPKDQDHEPNPVVSAGEPSHTSKLSGEKRKMGSTRSKLRNIRNQTMTDEGLKQHEDMDIGINVSGETSELETARAVTAALSKSTSPEHTVHNIESSISETYLFDDKTHLNPAVTCGQHCPSSEEAQHQLKERNTVNLEGHKTNELILEKDTCLLEIAQENSQIMKDISSILDNKNMCHFTEEVAKEQCFQAHCLLLCKDRSSDIQDMSYQEDLIVSRTNTLDEVNDKEVSQDQNLKVIVPEGNDTVKINPQCHIESQVLMDVQVEKRFGGPVNDNPLTQEEFNSQKPYGELPSVTQKENVLSYTLDAVNMFHKGAVLSDLSGSDIHVSEKDGGSNADKISELKSQQRILSKPDQNKSDAKDVQIKSTGRRRKMGSTLRSLRGRKKEGPKDHQDEAIEDELNTEVDMNQESSFKVELKLRVEPKCNTSDLEKTEMTHNATDIMSASLISTQTLNQDPNITINMGLGEVVSDTQPSIFQMRDIDESKTTERKTMHSISSVLIVREEAPMEKKEEVNLKFDERGDTLTGIVQTLLNTTHRPKDQDHEPDPGAGEWLDSQWSAPQNYVNVQGCNIRESDNKKVDQNSEEIQVVQEEEMKNSRLIAEKTSAVHSVDFEINNSTYSREAEKQAKRLLNDIQETENTEQAFHKTRSEINNTSQESSPAKMRRKLGSTRMSLRPRKENLHTEKEDDNEVLELAKDTEKNRMSEPGPGITVQELHLETQLIQGATALERENIFESMMVCESYLKPMAHLSDLGSEGKQIGHLTLSHHSESEAFPENDTTVPCRRRKMGSNRKKQRQDHKEEPLDSDNKTDAGGENNLKSNTEENAGFNKNQKTEVATSYDESQSQPSNINTDLESWQVTQQVTTVTLKGDQEERKERQPSGYSKVSDGKCYNVVLVGNSNVGKTCFMRRVQRGTFSSDFCSSIGIDTCMKAVTVDGKTVSLCLWDTAGQERFRSITRQIFHKAQVFLLMYDITSSESFSDVRYWLSCIQEGAAEDVIILLIGNKNDCERQVQSSDGESLAKEHNIDFMECSAASGDNVIKCTETIARILSKKHNAKEDMILHKPQTKKSSSCC